MNEYLNLRAIWAWVITFAFFINSLGLITPSQAQEIVLPIPGTMVSLSPKFDPPILKGLKVHTKNPFKFDFILDPGNDPHSLKDESTKLIKYFLASLTIPEKDLWVNLSPYEKNRIVPESFGKTEMGRDLLAEDYMLKQITASLIYPEGEIGKRFWKRVYEEAARKFGTTNIPVNTFNKVWIIPEKAVVYENAKAGTVYVVDAKLKVMLEEDYLALQKNAVIPQNDAHSLGSRIIREIVIPQLTKEVNEGKNFSQLRQVYNSLILATWYKNKIKDSILVQVYENKKKVTGILSSPNSFVGDPQQIYQRYLQAFKKGVYSYIKEEFDPVTQENMPRKYFSGGESFFGLSGKLANAAMFVDDGSSKNLDLVQAEFLNSPGSSNAAMKALVLYKPNGSRFDIYEDKDDVSKSGAAETIKIIEDNNKVGELSVIGLFTGTRGKAFSDAFVKQLIDRQAAGHPVDISRTKLFYLDEYYMGKRGKRGFWQNDPRSYYYFSRKNLIEPLRAAGVNINPDHVFVLDGEAENANGEIDRYTQELIQALTEKAKSRLGAEAKIDIMNMGSGSKGHLAFIEETEEVSKEMLNLASKESLMAIRNNNKFIIHRDIGDSEGIIRYILKQRRRLRSLDEYKEDLRSELQKRINENPLYKDKDIVIKNEKLEALVKILQAQVATFFVDDLSAQEKARLEEEFADIRILNSEELYTQKVGEEELAFSTIVDNYSDFPDEIDEMTGKALTTQLGTILNLSKRARVYAFGPKTTQVMGQVSRIPKVSPGLPLSVLLKHPDAKFILDQEAAGQIENLNAAMIGKIILPQPTSFNVEAIADDLQLTYVQGFNGEEVLRSYGGSGVVATFRDPVFENINGTKVKKYRAIESPLTRDEFKKLLPFNFEFYDNLFNLIYFLDLSNITAETPGVVMIPLNDPSIHPVDSNSEGFISVGYDHIALFDEEIHQESLFTHGIASCTGVAIKAVKDGRAYYGIVHIFLKTNQTESLLDQLTKINGLMHANEFKAESYIVDYRNSSYNFKSMDDLENDVHQSDIFKNKVKISFHRRFRHGEGQVVDMRVNRTGVAFFDSDKYVYGTSKKEGIIKYDWDGNEIPIDAAMSNAEVARLAFNQVTYGNEDNRLLYRLAAEGLGLQGGKGIDIGSGTNSLAAQGLIEGGISHVLVVDNSDVIDEIEAGGSKISKLKDDATRFKTEPDQFDVAVFNESMSFIMAGARNSFVGRALQSMGEENQEVLSKAVVKSVLIKAYAGLKPGRWLLIKPGVSYMGNRRWPDMRAEEVRFIGPIIKEVGFEHMHVISKEGIPVFIYAQVPQQKVIYDPNGLPILEDIANMAMNAEGKSRRDWIGGGVSALLFAWIALEFLAEINFGQKEIKKSKWENMEERFLNTDMKLTVEQQLQVWDELKELAQKEHRQVELRLLTIKALSSSDQEVPKMVKAYIQSLLARAPRGNEIIRDAAMYSGITQRRFKDVGGIDLTSPQIDSRLGANDREEFGNGQGIVFHVDPAQLAELQNSTGFTPVVISILPMKSLRQFLTCQTI